MKLRERATADPEGFDRRQKYLLMFAWAATLLPLVAFAYLTWESIELKRKVDNERKLVAQAQAERQELEKTKTRLTEEIAKFEGKLDAQRKATQHYRDFAGIRIRFYRESDRAVVEQALVNLGFKIDSALGQSKLIDLQPNTIAYGRDVATEDLRDIALALVQAGFPLKRVAPAQTQPDPKLIQIYASKETDQKCGLLKPDDIRAGRVCGARQS